MKTFFTLAFTFLVTVRLCSQVPNYVFNDRVDVLTNTGDTGMRCMYWNNGIVYAGYCTDSSGTNGISLIYYDTNGVQVWRTTYFPNGYADIFPWSICATNDYAFYVCGKCRRDSSAQSDYFHAKFDNNGDSLYFRFFGDTLDNDAPGIIALTNDTLLLVSNTTSGSNPNQFSISLSKFDTSGNIVVTQALPYATKYAQQLSLISPNRIIIGGTKSNTLIFADEYDDGLNYISSLPLLNFGHEYYNKMAITDSFIFITSMIWVYYPPNPNIFDAVCIRKMDLNGAYIDTVLIGQNQNNMYPMDLIMIDTALIACATNVGGINYLYFLNYSLDTICKTATFCPAGPTSSLFDICLMPGNKITGTGMIYAYPVGTTQDQWCFMTENIIDYLTSQCGYVNSSEETISNESLTLWPNPASEQVNLSLDNAPTGTMCISIINTTGQIVYFEMIDQMNGEFHKIIDTREFAEGVYMMRCETEYLNVISRKFVICK